MFSDHKIKADDYRIPPDRPWSSLPIQSSPDTTPKLLRELIDEIRGLRRDLRQEVLAREIARLPEPVREG